jgi:plastocyanin
MTSALRICFSALVLLGLAASATLATSVRGSVELVATRDPMVRKHKDYSGVVVWLEPLVNSVSPAMPSRPAQMIQKNKMFTPHVLAVPLGGTVSFPNLDPIFHNAFSNFNGQLFDVGLYKPGSSRTVVFRRAGIVRVFCNIHPQMSAVIAVLDTPYFAVSNKAGAFEIVNVPPGEYQLHVFHERAAEETLDSLTRKCRTRTNTARIFRRSLTSRRIRERSGEGPQFFTPFAAVEDPALDFCRHYRVVRRNRVDCREERARYHGAQP